MTSYRRTNDPRPLEVEPSTAGASGGRDHGNCLIDLHDHALVFVIRASDSEPGLYLAEGVTKGHAILLLEMMAANLRKDFEDDVISAH